MGHFCLHNHLLLDTLYKIYERASYVKFTLKFLIFARGFLSYRSLKAQLCLKL